MVALYRRICVLRARGLDTEADRLQQHEFAAARLAAESAMGETSEGPAADKFQALLEAEETRVSEALLLAEILAPLIAEKINSASPAVSTASARAPSPQSGAPARNAVPRRRDDPAPSIADLIDGMLGQERTAH